MKKVAFILETKHDMSVLQCVYNEDKLELGEDEIAALNSARLAANFLAVCARLTSRAIIDFLAMTLPLAFEREVERF